MKKIPALSVLLLFAGALYAQRFGGNPASLRWKQVDTDTVRVIFPVGMDSMADRVAAVTHALAARRSFSLGAQFRKIDIVLQPQTVIANGYVALGPYRSEFFTTPDLNNLSQGSLPWTDQLAVHEYRHVQQINNFRNGLSRFMRAMAGEQGYDLAINAAIPDWFYEGDAVFAETALTAQGRGRLPAFMNAYPALWQAGKKFRWMKWRNGSLKEYVPNHYHLGYLLVNFGVQRYGPEFWRRVTRDASAYKGLFYPFQSAIRRYAGIPFRDFVGQAVDHYRRSIEAAGTADSGFLFAVNRRFVTDRTFPYAAGSDSLVYLKYSYRQRPAFYLRDANGEHRVRIRDLSIDDQFSYRNGRIVYAAYESDPRWTWLDHSVIRLLDMATGIQRTIGRHTRYFTPDISSDGNRIAAVEVNSSGSSSLVILDAVGGKPLRTIHHPEVSLFTDPKFIGDDTLVANLRLPDGRMKMALVDLRSGTLADLLPATYSVIGYPCASSGRIYFTGSFSGNDALYYLEIRDRKLYRTDGSQLGRYFVHASQDTITWSEFSAEGYQLRRSAVNDLIWTETILTENQPVRTRYSVGQATGLMNLLDSVPPRHFETGRYRRSTRLLNFHSWRPYYSDPIFTYSLYGENVLNTMQSELYYIYNENERTSGLGVTATYGGFFPWLSIGSEFTFGRTTTVGQRQREWDQYDNRIGITVPLQYAKRRTFRNFSAGSSYVLRQEYNKGFYKDSLGTTSFGYLLHQLSWTQQVQRAVQHIYPRFAYSAAIQHRHAISQLSGYQFSGSGSLYIPGLSSTHNLVLTGTFQERDTLGQVVFADRFSYSRGYRGRYFSRMWRLSANYHFPLWYPDWGLGNIVYLLRLRANAFFDHTRVYSRDKSITRDQRSAGLELFIDTKWWNQYPLTFGIRFSRLLDPDQFNAFRGNRIEMVLPVSILPR